MVKVLSATNDIREFIGIPWVVILLTERVFRSESWEPTNVVVDCWSVIFVDGRFLIDCRFSLDWI